MRKASTIAGKELRDVLREKSLVTAFLVQLFLAGFSALLLTGLTVLHDPEALDAAPDATVAYVGPGGLLPYLRDAGHLDIEEMGSEEALAAFRDSQVLGIIEERYSDEDGLRAITLVLADGELQTTLLVTQMKGILQEYEDALRLDRQGRIEQDIILLADAPRPDGPYAFVYATLIPLLVITPVFLSGAIAGDALSQESRTRTLLVMRSTPVGPTALVVGKLLVPVLLVPVQVAIWLLLFWFNGFATAAPLTVIAFATMLGVFLTAAGSIVAALVRDESVNQAAYAVLVMAVAVVSLILPRDPMNVIALLATGVPDARVWRSVAWLAVVSLATLWAGITLTRRRIVTDRL